jgi:penicillin amidase
VDFKRGFSMIAMEALEARGLDIELAARLGIGSASRDGGEVVQIDFRRGDDVIRRKFKRLVEANMDELAGLQGPDPAGWRWGDAHQARSEHRPFSRVPALARWFEPSVGMGGDTHSVVATRVILAPGSEGRLYDTDHSASLRAVYDLADRRRSGVMHSTGQSGIVFSGDYRRFVEPWSRGERVPLWPEAPPAAVLVVRPAAAGGG